VTRAVLDTNVLVSALINAKGAPHHILESLEQGKFELVTSLPCLDELEDVLGYARIQEKYALTHEDIQKYLVFLKRQAHFVHVPVFTTSLCAADPDDDKFLLAAIFGQAQYIVTGDPHLLNMTGFLGINTVTPRNFDTAVLGSLQVPLPGMT
jgi:putative PIN family toxin of toxin-antitoxin system